VLLDGLRAVEQRMVGDKRNQKACERAFSAVAGQPVVVTLDSGGEPSNGGQDAFTREVADLFGGSIEGRG